MNYQFLGILIFSLALGSCSHLNRNIKSQNINYPPELQKVYSHLGEDKLESAHQRVDEYINKAENIDWYGHAYFLKAYIYESQGQNQKAIDFYRKSIQHSAQYDSLVEAKALYNLSFVNEKMLYKSEMVSNLLDLMKRPQYFDQLTSLVETPARLAAAFASQNKMPVAIGYHQKAVSSFEKLSQKNKLGRDRDEISKSLYYLGFAVLSDKSLSFDVWRDQLQRGQKYLLASAEASKGPWSERSVETLMRLYDQGWDYIQTYDPSDFKNDSLAYKRNQHYGQLERASDFYDLVHRLRAEEFPLNDVNPRSKKMMDESQRWLTRLEKFSRGLDLGPQMTRDQKLVQKKLTTPVDIPKPKVILNKEASEPLSIETETPLPPVEKKQNIGKDPNL